MLHWFPTGSFEQLVESLSRHLAIHSQDRAVIPQSHASQGWVNLRKQYLPAARDWPVVDKVVFPMTSMPTDETDLIGIMGEHFVRLFDSYPARRKVTPLKRYTSYSSAPWMTLAPTTGLANFATSSRASHLSKVKPTPTLRTSTPSAS